MERYLPIAEPAAGLAVAPSASGLVVGSVVEITKVSDLCHESSRLEHFAENPEGTRVPCWSEHPLTVRIGWLFVVDAATVALAPSVARNILVLEDYRSSWPVLVIAMAYLEIVARAVVVEFGHGFGPCRSQSSLTLGLAAVGS